MTVWMVLLIPSVLIGVLCAFLIKKKWGIFVAGLVPWLGVLIALLCSVYLAPYDELDASMWPVAQFFGGNMAAFAGVMAYVFTKKLVIKENR